MRTPKFVARMSGSRRGLRPLVVLASAVVGLIVAGLLTGMAFAGIGGGPGGPGGPGSPGGRGDGGPGHHRHGPVDGPRGADQPTPPDAQQDGAVQPDGAAQSGGVAPVAP